MWFEQFEVYNACLRQNVKDKMIFVPLQKADNLFPTTICLLSSAVVKISRAVKLSEGTKLYRGLGGLMELPDALFKEDSNGRRGYAEWGFMSTTSNKSVALDYSGVKEGLPLPMVLELRVSAVDRGGCIQDLSQYPKVRFLFV
jgi:hypothetical protein